MFYHDDNTAMAQILKLGRNPTLRNLGWTHNLALNQAHEEIHKPHSQLGLIESASMCADVPTKAFVTTATKPCAEARLNVNIIDP